MNRLKGLAVALCLSRACGDLADVRQRCWSVWQLVQLVATGIEIVSQLAPEQPRCLSSSVCQPFHFVFPTCTLLAIGWQQKQLNSMNMAGGAAGAASGWHKSRCGLAAVVACLGLACRAA